MIINSRRTIARFQHSGPLGSWTPDLRPGDWIIYDASGIKEIVSTEVFKAKYEEIKP